MSQFHFSHAHILVPAMLLGACTPASTPGQHPSRQAALQSSSDAKDVTFSEFIRARTTRFVVAPEFNAETNKVKLIKELRLRDSSLKMSFRIDPKQDGVKELYEHWNDGKNVTVEWGATFSKVEGMEAREVQLRLEDVEQVMLDPSVRTICGRYKVVGPVQLVVDGQTYNGSFKLSFTDVHYATLGEPVESTAANVACEEETWWLFVDYCEDSCAFIMPAGPKIEATCTLGGIVGMVTGSGTPIAAGGGAQVGVLATATASCWNEFKGKCKLVGAFWGDYCTCSSSSAPKLVCNTVGSPCQGTAGASCSNPSWSCGPTTGSTVDAGTPPSTVDGGVREVEGGNR